MEISGPVSSFFATDGNKRIAIFGDVHFGTDKGCKNSSITIKDYILDAYRREKAEIYLEIGSRDVFNTGGGWMEDVAKELTKAHIPYIIADPRYSRYYNQFHSKELFMSLVLDTDEEDLKNVLRLIDYLLTDDADKLRMYFSGISDPYSFDNLRILRQDIQEKFPRDYPMISICETLKKMMKNGVMGKINGKRVEMHENAKNMSELENQNQDLYLITKSFLQEEQEILVDQLKKLAEELHILLTLQEFESNTKKIYLALMENLLDITSLFMDSANIPRFLTTKSKRIIVFAGELHAQRYRKFFKDGLKWEVELYDSNFRGLEDWKRCVKVPSY